jgi:uncharacterized membrane protein YfcA
MSPALPFTVIACASMFVQSFTGFAGSLVAVPLFTLFLAPRESLPAYQLLMLLANAWLVIEARQHVDWRRVGMLLIGGAIGTPIGAYALKQLPTHTLSIIISVLTLAAALLFVLKIKIALRENARTQVGIGLLSGALGGAISQSGPPVVIYGLARGWDKNAFRTTLLTYFLCLCIMTSLSYWYLGLITRNSLFMCSVATGPTFVAIAGGVLLKNRVSELLFRQAVLGVIMAVSLIGLVQLL